MHNALIIGYHTCIALMRTHTFIHIHTTLKYTDELHGYFWIIPRWIVIHTHPFGYPNLALVTKLGKICWKIGIETPKKSHMKHSSTFAGAIEHHKDDKNIKIILHLMCEHRLVNSNTYAASLGKPMRKQNSRFWTSNYPIERWVAAFLI